jgi:hypothetical protein
MNVPVTDVDWPTSPLDAVERAFAALTCEPHPLSLDLDRLAVGAGLPGGVMALPALRRWLLKHPKAFEARDVVWRELIRRARLDGPSWVIAAVAMALPALRRHSARLAAGWPGEAQDLAAEVLTGFLTGLRDRVDVDRPAPYASLCMAGWRAGYQLRERNGAEAVPVDDLDHWAGSRTPRRPWGHPDLLVRRAVELGLIEAEDEQPYIELRLGRRAIEPIARREGLAVDTLRRRMERIDARLAAALAQGLLDGPAAPVVQEELTVRAARRIRMRAARAATPTAA